MEQVITGRCFCGAVTFRVAGPPVGARACWCRDCQYLSAGNASINLIVAAGTLAVSGQAAEYVSRADSGTVMHRRFCPACGTPLFSAAADRPDYVVIRAGALDDPDLARPAAVIWTSSAPRWASIDPALPSFAHHVPAVPKP